MALDAPARAPREFDLVVYGATGFTGRLAARYLARAAPRGVKIALAGRNEGKLLDARGDATRFDVVLASDEASLAALARRASTVLSFAGPYDAADGIPLALARACASAGADYLDITGEPQFVAAVIDACHDLARTNACALVSCCGYDSVPWDLGAAKAVEKARASAGGATSVVATGHAGSSRGGVSGGTIASAANIVAKKKTEVERGMGDPHYLAKRAGGWREKPDAAATKRWSSPQGTYRFDETTGFWTMPSIMAGINTKVVARSYALAPEAYGEKFTYDESDLCASKTSAIAGTVGLGLFGLAFVTTPLRWLMRKTILPRQGEGPSEELRENGYSHVYVVAKAEDAQGNPLEPWVAEFEFKNADPGYKGTAALACEAALCLAIPSERAKLPWVKTGGGGCLTPSVALGDVLVERLQKAENFSFTVKKLKDTVFLV